jgi:hypothetical protein
MEESKILSRNMVDIITCILSYYGLMLISASISNGRLIVVCAKDASIPPPLAQVAVVYVCEVLPYAFKGTSLFMLLSMKGAPVIVTLPTPVVSTLMTVSLVKVSTGDDSTVSTGFGQVVCMHPFWFSPCTMPRACVVCNVALQLNSCHANGNVQLVWNACHCK